MRFAHTDVRILRALPVCVVLAVSFGCHSADPWPRSTPESEGMLSQPFARWAREVASRHTESLLVLRNGRLVHEWHDWDSGRRRKQYTASLVKGVFGGLALSLLAAEGRVDLDAPVSSYVSRWRDDPLRSQISLRQLATHSSGLANATTLRRARRPPARWVAQFWKLDPDRTPVHVALEETPLRFEPGRGFAYSNPGFAVLSLVLAAVLHESAEPSLPSFLRDRVFRPIGVPDDEWSIGYGRPFEVGGLETWATWGGGRISPEALARLGTLLLRRGDWEGLRVLPERAVEQLGTYAGTPVNPGGAWPAPSIGWWTNARGAWRGVPRDAFAAVGAGDRLLLIVPSLDLVVVRLGARLDPEADHRDLWEPLGRILIEPLMDAFPRPPVARSEALAGAWFDPPSSIVCRARGSDNWPLTWTRDGSVFASYGDGFGFEPNVERKLSLGFARIDGGPRDFDGTNVRSASGERTGDGPAGAKASGLLAVDGVLYMWARNLENAQLAWSSDDGRTWEWGFRFRDSFGSPTFLNFGADYAASRDGFVYVYSQDGPSAYAADDRMVLARVPRERIRERDAYEFFAGLDAAGGPLWTPDLERRAGVFEARGSCRRSEVVFVPQLARYLMALGFDARGGWGLFEAPEPWGPWRTVYFTRRWDLGDTHSYRLPSAWIGKGGRTLSVVVSGRDSEQRHIDAFCVRGLHLLPL